MIKWKWKRKTDHINIKRHKDKDIKRLQSRHGLTYTNKHKRCLSMMILICTKQNPTSNWGLIYGKVKEHWD